MTKQKLLLTAAGAGLILATAAGAAFARKSSHDDGDAAEIAAFNSASVSLTDAIHAAEAKTGAKAIAAEFEDEDGAFVYEVELIDADGAEWEAYVDIDSGAATKVEQEDDEHEMDDDDGKGDDG